MLTSPELKEDGDSNGGPNCGSLGAREALGFGETGEAVAAFL